MIQIKSLERNARARKTRAQRGGMKAHSCGMMLRVSALEKNCARSMKEAKRIGRIVAK
jgi:hypothetical protein